MPHLSCDITPWGPLLNIGVAPSKPRADALKAAGQPIPQIVVAKLVIDTGATRTSIDGTILAKLGLSPTGTSQIHTPSTSGVPHNVNVYDVGLFIYEVQKIAHVITALAVVDGNYQGCGIDGLLGRDVLAFAQMTYSGFDGVVYLSF